MCIAKPPLRDANVRGRYQWLLFDADGTLFDYDRAEQVALSGALERIGVAFQLEHLIAYRRFNHEVWQAFERGEITPDTLKVRRFERLFREVGISHSPVDFSGLYLDALADCSALVEGAEAVVRALVRGHRLAVVTNGLQAVQRRRMARSTVRDCFLVVVISEEIGAAKPAREFFDATFARLGNPARHQVLMIGDNWNSDIVGGVQYGLDTCWYNPGSRPRPDGRAITREIAALEELIPWLT